MPQWEYLEVVCNYSRGTWWNSYGDEGKLLRVDVDAAVQGGRIITPIFDDLGLQGWELIGVTADPIGFFRFFLKRPK